MFNQIFSAHGAIMILFMAMPFVVGLMNFAVPLQLGVRDVGIPYAQLRQLLADCLGRPVDQHFAGGRRVLKATWWVIPTERIAYSPAFGVRLLSLSLQISGIGHPAGGHQLRHNILKLRAPGMSYMRMRSSAGPRLPPICSLSRLFRS